MVNILMPEKFQFGTLFEGLISISGISPITTKIQICYLEVMVLKRMQNRFWYFLLHKRNNANNLHKIAIANRDKEAAAKFFVLTFSAATQT